MVLKSAKKLMELKEQMQIVTDSYNKRQKKQKEALQQIWKDFNKETKALTR